MMKKKTIKELEHEIKCMELAHNENIKHQNWQSKEITLLRDLVKSLEIDKSWLKSMHSNMLQATAEMFRNK